jgi:hypothetical protein
MARVVTSVSERLACSSWAPIGRTRSLLHLDRSPRADGSADSPSEHPKGFSFGSLMNRSGFVIGDACQTSLRVLHVLELL